MSDSLWYHGTDEQSALTLLQGMALDASEAARRKIDGPAAFFLAQDLDDASFFATRRGRGAILEVRFSSYAYRRLRRSGMLRQPLPDGRYATFRGDELVIPPGL